jgi:pantoate--beta-alanine ligase
MRTIRTIAELRAHVRAQRAAGHRIGLVPTMGAFHAGHESLIRAARAHTDEVIVSLFVNPAQFNDPRDLAAYPRDEQRDADIAARLGADILFAPPPEEVYPPGFSTTVGVPGLSDVLEGAQRGPGHFAGVCTVVAKLFNMVEPDVAYFGQKDGQQVAVLKRMARDLDFPVRVEVLPTVREPDGLAMSSRNVRLSPDERARAVALPEALRAAADAIDDDPLAAGRAVLGAHGVEPEYLALVDPDTFLRPAQGRVLVAVAATVGDTRLIDNVLIERAATPERRGADPKGAVSVLPTP